jgi:hypothetical protein
MSPLATQQTSAAPQAANLPPQLPKTQSDWTAFLNALSTWRPAPAAWQPLVLQNNWVAYGDYYAAPQYQVDLSGRVYLRGLITGGTVTDLTVLAVLPVSPSFDLVTIAQAYSGSAYSPVRLQVASNGGAAAAGSLLILDAGSFSGDYFVSLDQVSFSLAQ